MNFFRKNKKIESAIQTLDQIQQAQVLEEIKGLKVRTLISILTAIGAVVGFLIVHNNSINQILTKKPVVTILSEEYVIKSNATVSILKIENEKHTEIINLDFEKFSNGIELEAGMYEARLSVAGQQFWDDKFLLSDNDKLNIKIPKLLEGKIKLFITNNTKEPLPEQQLDLEIRTSGNGYLWIFEILDNSIKRQYPPESGTYSNRISVVEVFKFPDSEGLALFAGAVPKVEKYLFVATSIDDVNLAEKIATMLTKKQIEKGNIVQNNESNWGAEMVSIKIKDINK